MVSAKQIDAYLKRSSSPLVGQGSAFVNAGRKYGVDPRLLVAIAGAESSFGKHTSGRYNPFGWGPGINFSSWSDAINTVAKGLKTGYLDQGLKSIPKIGSKWAPIGAGNDPTNLNSNWVKNVTNLYKELGGKGGVGAPSGPSGALGGLTGLPGGVPDASAIAQSFLGGKDYDPLAQLEQLAQFAASSGGVPSAGEAAGIAGGKAKISPGGGWGGSKGVASGLIQGLGLTVTSEKRDTQMTASGNTSDHWVGSKNAYAFDLGGAVSAMDAAAARLARRLGVSYKKGQPLVATVNRGGYRIQVLYRTNVGGNHYDHLHIGVKKL